MESSVALLLLVVVIYGTILQSDSCPKECACSDTRIDCSSRHLHTIPDNIPESVTSFDLHDNNIREVDAEKLSHLQKLETLSLHMNHLVELKSFTFANLTKLRKLNVRNNDIDIIDDNVFTDIPSLQDLDLTNNNISEIAGKFNIASLHRLNLGHNQITSLQDDTLNGLRNLYYLVVAYNKISYISKSALDGMINLSYLVLRGNPIKIVDSIFMALETLSRLDVSSCHLSNIPKGLPRTLRHLNISDNNLTMIESRDLSSTRYLEVLILNNNQIQYFQKDALRITPYLTELYINHNKIRWLPQIPKSIEKLTADENNIQQLSQLNFAHDSTMKVLSLSRNGISEIPPNTFSRLANLSILLLDHNDITDLKNMTFAGLRQLIFLNLEFNPVEKIECRAFGGLQKLQQLKLANTGTNQTVIEGIIFQDIPSLSSLDLQGSPSIINDILTSSNLLRSLHSIQQLNLMNGSLERLSMEIQASLPNLKSLKLSANPWHCDSAITELRDWINESPKMFGNSRIMCASPDHLKGRPIQDVSVVELMLAMTASLSVEILNTASFYDNVTKTDGTVDGNPGYMTLSHLSTKVIETEHLEVTALPGVQDIISVLDLASTSALCEHIFSSEELHVLHSLVSSTHYYIHPISTVASSVIQLSKLTDLQMSPMEELVLLTTGSTISTPLTPTDVTSSKMFPSMYKVTASTNFRPSTTRKFTMVKSSPWNQVSTTSMYDDAQPVSGAHVPADSLSTISHSTTNISHHISSTMNPRSTIILQPTRKIITTTSTIWPTRNSPTIQYSTGLTDAILAYPKTRKQNKIISTMIPSFSILSSTLTFSMTTKFTTESSTILIRSKATPPISVHAIKTYTQFEMSPIATSMTDKLPQITTMKLLLVTSSPNIAVSKSIPERWHTSTKPNIYSAAVTESTVVQETTQTMLDNSKDFDKIKSGTVKTNSRLPTFSSSTETKMRAIIIIVSSSLLALVVGLFIVVVLVRHCKKRKRVFFNDHSQHTTEFQTETSDTVFIISHMVGEQTGYSNTDSNQDVAPVTSSNDSPEVKDEKNKTNKCLKFLRASSVISNAGFDCIRGQKEDDSEMLMSSWK